MSHRISFVACPSIAALFLGLAACYGGGPPAAPPQAAAPADAAPHGGGAPPDGGAPGLETAHAPIVAPAAGGAPQAAAGGGSPHGMLTWEAPPTWTQERPSNPMRMAQYRVPSAGGGAGDGECVVFYFGPGQGGDAPSNVARWVSMFSTPSGGPVEGRVTEQKLGDKLVTRIEAAGTYQPTTMMMGGPQPPRQPGSMMLGAIVPGADSNWFFRCIGPEKTIAANRAAFDGFIASVK